MAGSETESRRAKQRARGPGAIRYLYAAVLVGLGACFGIVVGSLSDTPRLLLERLRGPVETLDVEPAESAPAPADAVDASTPPLQAFGELQGQKAAKAKPMKPAPALAAEPAPAPKVTAEAPKPAATTDSARPAAANPGVVATAPAAPAPAAPAVSSAPPKPAPEPKTANEIVTALEKRTAPAGGARVVQVLSLVERKRAEDLVTTLRAKGYESYASEMPQKPGRYRVRVRPKGSQSPAELEKKLRDQGFHTWTTAE
jgi:cell division septation protein DedD